MNLEGRRFLVVGTGKSGIAAAELLYVHHFKVTLYDSNERVLAEEIYQKSPMLKNVSIITGELTEALMKETDIAVLSPGVPTDAAFVNQLRENNVGILGEIELAYELGKGTLVAITGTNGKTTTTSLVGEIMAAYYCHTQVVGNIGIPYTMVVDEQQDDTVTVAEISSFQLETIVEFHPKVSAILNITPDHLNRHYTMENYIAIKEAITKNQDLSDTCVLNYENEYTREFGNRCPAKVVFFSSKTVLSDGYFYKDGKIIAAENGIQEELLDTSQMKLVGMCNVENVMAAIAMGRAMNVPMDTILRTVKNFNAVEHRIEYVATKAGVRYYNDSKGTNPDAAIQGIKAMEGPTLLIGGGYDKGSEYDEWIQSFDGKVKLFVLIGATREKIAETAKGYGLYEQIRFADSLEEAMDICIHNAEMGDNVLLSPACASWGMFSNYEERGDKFKEIVLRLKE
ncbi:MAG: UDP-N-acetylmuramoyl-L-alanine--D-glutamate ligase [Lachnospiraceae bacterium]